MPYTLDWLLDRRLVRVRHFGDVATTEIQRSLDDILLQKDFNERPYLLVDVRDVTSYPSIADLFFFADGNRHQPRVSERTAFVCGPQTAESIDFLVTSASNRGFFVNAFTDEESAIDWLFSTSGAS